MTNYRIHGKDIDGSDRLQRCLEIACGRAARYESATVTDEETGAILAIVWGNKLEILDRLDSGGNGFIAVAERFNGFGFEPCNMRFFDCIGDAIAYGRYSCEDEDDYTNHVTVKDVTSMVTVMTVSSDMEHDSPGDCTYSGCTGFVGTRD